MINHDQLNTIWNATTGIRPHRPALPSLTPRPQRPRWGWGDPFPHHWHQYRPTAARLMNWPHLDHPRTNHARVTTRGDRDRVFLIEGRLYPMYPGKIRRFFTGYTTTTTDAADRTYSEPRKAEIHDLTDYPRIAQLFKERTP